MTASAYRIESQRIDAPANARATAWPSPTLVFLHEGLGSVSTWQQFPARLCALTGLPGLVYSRRGYGRSAPLAAPFDPAFLHQGAADEMNQVLAEHAIDDAILVGHSDGASIALIRGGQSEPTAPAHATRLHGIIAIAPHLFVEPVCVQAIAAVAERIAADPERLSFLARHHDDAAAIFKAWSQAWLDPAFQGLDLSAEVARIACPVLAVQGAHDQYGTLAQIHRLASLAPKARAVVLPDCRHSPHLEAEPALLKVCQAFIQALRPGHSQAANR